MVEVKPRLRLQGRGTESSDGEITAEVIVRVLASLPTSFIATPTSTVVKLGGKITFPVQPLLERAPLPSTIF